MQIKTETRVGMLVLVGVGIFFFMTTRIGVFRFDRFNYKSHAVYFNDVSGLEKKAEVKIAGVKVGWIENIELLSHGDYKAKAIVMVRKEYNLHNNAYAIVRQEGLLGAKCLEIIPGDPLLPLLESGSALSNPGRSPVSMDEILYQVKNITQNVQAVTDSLKNTFGSKQGEQDLKQMLDNFTLAAGKIAEISSRIDRTLEYNESHINAILSDMKEFVHELKTNIPAVGSDIHRVAERLETDFLPSLRSSVERISDVFDRDIARVARKLDTTAESIEDVALQAREGFRNISSVAAKVDEGKGLIGKLINDEEGYRDLRFAIGGVKNFLSRIENLNIVIDSHGEYMYGPAEHMTFQDAKGYVDVRIHPNDDYFYIFQVVGSQKGNLKRKITYRDWFDNAGREFSVDRLLEEKVAIPQLIGRIDTRKRYEDQLKFGLQVAKIYKDVALRAGLMESTFGLGVDFEIPFGNDDFRWITTLEAFDFRGRDRIDDNRPHFKWINRLFLYRTIYFAFGADDFISKHNANAFCGAGVRFCDDDLKYLISKIGLAGI